MRLQYKKKILIMKVKPSFFSFIFKFIFIKWDVKSFFKTANACIGWSHASKIFASTHSWGVRVVYSFSFLLVRFLRLFYLFVRPLVLRGCLPTIHNRSQTDLNALWKHNFLWTSLTYWLCLEYNCHK